MADSLLHNLGLRSWERFLSLAKRHHEAAVRIGALAHKESTCRLNVYLAKDGFDATLVTNNSRPADRAFTLKTIVDISGAII